MTMSLESDVMEDLFYEEAEGPARAYDELEAYDSLEEYDALEEDLYEEEFEEFDSLDELEAEGSDEDLMDAMEEAVVDALEAEDTDEFFRRLRRGLRGIVRRVAPIARTIGRGIRAAAPVVGQIARTVGPIASLIPHPGAQAVGRIASVAGQVLPADEFDAMEDLLDYAEEEDAIDAAAPVVAGLTIRRVMPGVSRLPRPQRRQLVRSVTRATRAVARRAGPRAARTVPQVVQAATRTARRRGVPARAVPRVVARAAARVARSPGLARRLARTTAPMGRIVTGTLGRRRRSYTLRGPVTISIQGR